MTTLGDLYLMAAESNRVTIDAIRTGSTLPRAVKARQQVCAVLSLSGWTFREIAAEVGMSKSGAHLASQAAHRRLWMFGVQVDPPIVRATTRVDDPVKVPETSHGMSTVAAGEDRPVPRRRGDEPENCIAKEAPAATTRTTCVDCPAPATPGGLIRCERCMRSDLHRRVTARPLPETSHPDPARSAVRQVRGVAA